QRADGRAHTPRLPVPDRTTDCTDDTDWFVLSVLSVQSVVSNHRSRRRHGQDLLVLGVVFILPETGRNEDQVLIHFIAGEDLAELGDEQVGAQVTGELLKLADVVGRRFADQETKGPFLL